MITKQTVQSILSDLPGYRIKKSYGQNFLISEAHLENIAQAIISHTEQCELLIEVGPGLGFLTEKLLSTLQKTTQKKSVIAVEKDQQLAEYLTKQFKSAPATTVINEDILKYLATIKARNYALVGNIPYYLTKFLISESLALTNPPQEIVFLIQKEVADKLTDTNRRGILAQSVALCAETQQLFTVPRTDFYPPPNVDGALIRIFNINKSPETEAVIALVKKGLQSPRKTLFNNLKSVYPVSLITSACGALGISPTIRGETLTPNQWRSLHTFISNNSQQ